MTTAMRWDDKGKWVLVPHPDQNESTQLVLSQLLRQYATDPIGDQIEVELQVESKNDYDYLVFEDMKPSGCEPVELRSGWQQGLGICSNMELRDQKVALFVT